MSEPIKAGDKVRIPELDVAAEVNNVYTVVGVNRFGWVWLSLDGENDNSGYDCEFVLRPEGDRWEVALAEERADVRWLNKITVEKVG